MIEWKEGSTTGEKIFQDLLTHYGHLSQYSTWPDRLAFEEYKWRSEFFYLAAEFFKIIGKDSVQGKYYTLKMMENYVRNRDTQIHKFEVIEGAKNKSSLGNPFADLYEEDSSKTAQYERNTIYYGCVNGKYPSEDGDIPLAKCNEENLERRVEIEKFSKVKQNTLKEIDEAIMSCKNIEQLKNTQLTLKILRRRICKSDEGIFNKSDLQTIWPWDDIYSSIH